jgi:hypothetical protein
MLAHWPAFLAHGASVLAPYLGTEPTRHGHAATESGGAREAAEACARLLDAVDAEVPAVFATLPPLPATPPAPPEDEFAPVRAALDAYRVTSPQMVVFSRLIRDALPA